MKIAVFHELPFGGAKRAVEALSLELLKNHQVSTFEAKTNFSKRSKGLLSRIRHDFVDLVRLAWAHWQLARQIDAKNFDLVLVHPSRYTQAPFLLSFLRTTTVYYCQEPLRLVYDPAVADTSGLAFSNQCYEFINRKWRKWIDYCNTTSAQLVLVNSQYSRGQVKQAYGISSSLCYLGVDPQLFRPQRETKTIGVLFFGTPVEIEGYDLLQAALETAKARKWKVRTLRRKINGEGVSDAELVRTINQSKLVVCLARNEPFGLTVLEAMSCGVPVIAVSEGGYRETVIAGETGLLVPRSPKALSVAINQLLADSSLRRKLGASGRQKVLSSWTWEKSGVRLNSLLSDTAKTSRSPNFGISGLRDFVLLLMFTGGVNLLAVLFFRQIRVLFPLPIPGPNSLVGFATYYGYPLWFEPVLFLTLISLPVVAALAFRQLAQRR